MPPKYKPGGKRFPPRVTSKPLPKQVINGNAGSATSEAPAASGLDREAENQFELELCWCIQQLELSLRSGKLSEKQSLDITKTVNLLGSNTASLIRKRQAMRNTLGDYRAKMELEEKQHGKYVSNVKFSAPKAKDNNKCMFLRKINAVERDTDEKEGGKEIEDKDEKNEKNSFVMSKEPSDVPFKFNFNTLGDYKAKMELEERQQSKYFSNVKFLASNTKDNNKCVSEKSQCRG